MLVINQWQTQRRQLLVGRLSKVGHLNSHIRHKSLFLALINIQFKHHHENPDGTFGPQVESHGVLSVLILKLPYTQIEQVCLVEKE